MTDLETQLQPLLLREFPQVWAIRPPIRDMVLQRAKRYRRHQPEYLGYVIIMVLTLGILIALDQLGVEPVRWLTKSIDENMWRGAIRDFLRHDVVADRFRACVQCNYDLRGRDGDACPECGAATRMNP